MRHIIENCKKFINQDVPSTQIISDKKRNILQNFKIKLYTNKIKIFYLVLDIILSISISYILVNLLPLSNDNKVYIGFSIYYISLLIMTSPVIFNIVSAIKLFRSAIFDINKEEAEHKVDKITHEFRNSIIPINYYIFVFISVYFPSFLIMYCMKFTGVNWSAVYYYCVVFIIAFIEIKFFSIASYLLLKLIKNKALYYNLKYNIIK
jgi:hypothetical protein